MGAQASEELATWASVSDLALITRRMRVIPTLPAECQVEAIRRMWQSLQWVPPAEVLITPGEASDRLFVVVRGEAEALIGGSGYIALLPEGAFVCEASLLGHGAPGREEGPRGWGASLRSPGQRADVVWPLRRWRRIPAGALSIVEEFLTKNPCGPRFQGKVRTTRRSLIATLSRQQFLAILAVHESPDVRAMANMQARYNGLQNVTVCGAEARALGAQDIAALRVVCEGPMNVSCQQAVEPTIRVLKQGIFGSCWGSARPTSTTELPPAQPAPELLID